MTQQQKFALYGAGIVSVFVLTAYLITRFVFPGQIWLYDIAIILGIVPGTVGAYLAFAPKAKKLTLEEVAATFKQMMEQNQSRPNRPTVTSPTQRARPPVSRARNAPRKSPAAPAPTPVDEDEQEDGDDQAGRDPNDSAIDIDPLGDGNDGDQGDDQK